MGTTGRHDSYKPPRAPRVLAAAAATLLVAINLAAGPSGWAEEATAAPHWVGTWAASPQPVWGPDFFAPLKLPRNLWRQTVRQVSRVSIGGPRLR